MKASWAKRELIFKRAAGTSRGILLTKPTYYLKLQTENSLGWGECSLLPGLSLDDRPNYEEKLNEICSHLESTESPLSLLNELNDWPSIKFGLEMALADLGLLKLEFWQNSDFENGKSGIPINGLIWMGNADFQRSQLHQLYNKGFRCIKFKIGRDYWEGGRNLLEEARSLDSKLEIRVDANGAFEEKEARKVLEDLASLNVHSIEQPIGVGQWNILTKLIRETPIPIALDEELIFCPKDKMEELIASTTPHYLILKPSLIGGWENSRIWIELAKKYQLHYWTTSALESQLGLQWVARFAAAFPVEIPQGLGTGSLYENNLDSDLEIIDQCLWRSKSNRFVEIETALNENTAQGMGGESSKQRKDHSKSNKKTLPEGE